MSALVFREFSVVLPRCRSRAQLRDLAASAREFAGNVLPSGIEGVRNAGCPLHPQPRVQSVVKHTSVVATGRTGTPGIPARNGFNGLLRALPGDRACLSPSPAELVSQPGRADVASANLTPASRRQDHTTSPSAATSFVSVPWIAHGPKRALP